MCLCSRFGRRQWLDVLSASENDNKIAWYENLGSGTFSTQNVITTAANGAKWVHAADLDSDGDMDVISASERDHKIAWYENLGSKAFSAQKVLSSNMKGAQCVYAGDLNNDGNIDILSASTDNNTIAWFENSGKGVFSTEQTISANAEKARCVFASDLDNDNDLDVLSASYTDDKVAWYENRLNQQFEYRVEACRTFEVPSGDESYQVTGTYFDTIPTAKGGDSFLTIILTINMVDVSVQQNDAELMATGPKAIFQWLDCNNSYAPIDGAESRSFTASENGDYAVQITSKGCIDTSACYNVSTVAMEELSQNVISIYPNPASEQLTIQMDNLTMESVQILGPTGQVVNTPYMYQNTIDLGNLSKGMYLIQIQTEQGIFLKKFFKECH